LSNFKRRNRNPENYSYKNARMATTADTPERRSDAGTETIRIGCNDSNTFFLTNRNEFSIHGDHSLEITKFKFISLFFTFVTYINV